MNQFRWSIWSSAICALFFFVQRLVILFISHFSLGPVVFVPFIFAQRTVAAADKIALDAALIFRLAFGAT